MGTVKTSWPTLMRLFWSFRTLLPCVMLAVVLSIVKILSWTRGPSAPPSPIFINFSGSFGSRVLTWAVHIHISTSWKVLIYSLGNHLKYSCTILLDLHSASKRNTYRTHDPCSSSKMKWGALLLCLNELIYKIPINKHMQNSLTCRYHLLLKAPLMSLATFC